MSSTAPSSYVFGTDGLELQRLALVHQAFAAASESLLERVPGRAPEVAYDLGCATGATTALVSGRTGALTAIGLDWAPSHIAAARKRASSHVRFEVHDVTENPFPAGPADLIYARLVLAHLADPLAAARLWVTQLRPGGHLVLDEIEWIRTERPAFTAHLRLVRELIAARGGAMEAGPALQRLGRFDQIATVHREIVELPVSTSLAAQMFATSLEIIGRDAVERGLIDAAGRVDLGSELWALADSDREDEISWGLHQAIHRRAL